MGGDTISRILAAAPWTRDERYTLILQPETAARRLREFLYGHGYTIHDEVAVLDGGRVYSVMAVRGGPDPNRADPLHTRLSAPLLSRHDEAARRYAARVEASLAREIRGLAPDSEAYRARPRCWRVSRNGRHKMPKVSDFLEVLEGFAPLFLKMQGDNVGLLVGDPERAVSRVVLTLDITPAVARAAAEEGAALIVSHHPVIFHPLAAITPADYNGAAVMTLVENRIAAICMHTNLDAAAGGVNDTLAHVLGLQNVSLIDDGGQGILRRGTLPQEMMPCRLCRICRATARLPWRALQ